MYDIARTVFLVEYTSVLLESENRAILQDYLTVFIAARAEECPNE